MRRKVPALVAANGHCRISRVACAGAGRPAGRDRPRRGQPLLGSRRRRPVPLRAGGGQLRARRRAGPGTAAAGARLLLRAQRFRCARERGCREPVQPGRLPDREPRGVQRPAPHDRHLQRDRRRSSIDALSLTDTAAINSAGPTSLPSSTREAGSWHSPATPTETTRQILYYQFVPIGVGGKQVASPFRLTRRDRRSASRTR